MDAVVKSSRTAIATDKVQLYENMGKGQQHTRKKLTREMLGGGMWMQLSNLRELPLPQIRFRYMKIFFTARTVAEYKLFSKVDLYARDTNM